MSASSKLSNAVKALCFLAKHYPSPQNSTALSADTGINASKLRRLLSALSKAGILTATKGAAGGFMLLKPPDEIHLQEIYCALEDRKAFHLDVTTNPDNTVQETHIVNNYFLDLFSEIQKEIEDKMRTIKLSQIINHISEKKELS
jgi:Rrf2 family protein